MNSRQLVILTALAVFSVGVTAAVLQTGTTTIASDRHGEIVLPALRARTNDITALTIRDGADTLTIDRRDNAFVTADAGYPVKTDAVRDLVASSIELTFEEARTSDPARYADLGLADPGAPNAGKEIIARAAGGELADIIIGSRDSTVGGAGGGVFIRLKGQPQTFLARGSVRLPPSRSDWFVPVDLDVKRSEIRSVSLTGGGRDAVTATANADKPGELTLADVPEKHVAETFKVSRFATLVDSFSFQDVRKRTKAADGARRMVAEVGDGLRLTFTSVGELPDGWVQITAEATGDTTPDPTKLDKAKAINAKVGAYDFRLPANQAELLGWTMADLTSEQKS